MISNRFYQAAAVACPSPAEKVPRRDQYLLNRPCCEHGRLFSCVQQSKRLTYFSACPIKSKSGDLVGIPFRLGDWLVEPSLNRLSRGETTIQLELKVMDVLVCLAERAGEVIDPAGDR